MMCSHLGYKVEGIDLLCQQTPRKRATTSMYTSGQGISPVNLDYKFNLQLQVYIHKFVNTWSDQQRCSQNLAQFGLFVRIGSSLIPTLDLQLIVCFMLVLPLVLLAGFSTCLWFRLCVDHFLSSRCPYTMHSVVSLAFWLFDCLHFAFSVRPIKLVINQPIVIVCLTLFQQVSCHSPIIVLSAMKR